MSLVEEPSAESRRIRRDDRARARAFERADNAAAWDREREKEQEARDVARDVEQALRGVDALERRIRDAARRVGARSAPGGGGSRSKVGGTAIHREVSRSGVERSAGALPCVRPVGGGKPLETSAPKTNGAGARSFHFAQTEYLKSNILLDMLHGTAPASRAIAARDRYLRRRAASGELETSIAARADRGGAGGGVSGGLDGGGVERERGREVYLSRAAANAVILSNISNDAAERTDFWRAIEEVEQDASQEIVLDPHSEPEFWARVAADVAEGREVPKRLADAMSQTSPGVTRLKMAGHLIEGCEVLAYVLEHGQPRQKIGERPAYLERERAAVDRPPLPVRPGLGAVRFRCGRRGRIQTRLVIGLPHELSPEGRRTLVEAFIEPLAKAGLRYQAAIHCPEKGKHDDRQYHLHLDFSTRPAERITHPVTGKACWDFEVVEDVPGRRGRTRRPFAQKKLEAYADKDSPARERARFAALANEALAAEGHAARLDPRTHAEMGIAGTPRERLSPADYAAERAGIQTQVGAALAADHRERRDVAFIGDVERAMFEVRDVCAGVHRRLESIQRAAGLIWQSKAFTNPYATSTPELPEVVSSRAIALSALNEAAQCGRVFVNAAHRRAKLELSRRVGLEAANRVWADVRLVPKARRSTSDLAAVQAAAAVATKALKLEGDIKTQRPVFEAARETWGRALERAGEIVERALNEIARTATSAEANAVRPVERGAGATPPPAPSIPRPDAAPAAADVLRPVSDVPAVRELKAAGAKSAGGRADVSLGGAGVLAPIAAALPSEKFEARKTGPATRAPIATPYPISSKGAGDEGLAKPVVPSPLSSIGSTPHPKAVAPVNTQRSTNAVPDETPKPSVVTNASPQPLTPSEPGNDDPANAAASRSRGEARRKKINAEGARIRNHDDEARPSDEPAQTSLQGGTGVGAVLGATGMVPSGAARPPRPISAKLAADYARMNEIGLAYLARKRSETTNISTAAEAEGIVASGKPGHGPSEATGAATLALDPFGQPITDYPARDHRLYDAHDDLERAYGADWLEIPRVIDQLTTVGAEQEMVAGSVDRDAGASDTAQQIAVPRQRKPDLPIADDLRASENRPRVSPVPSAPPLKPLVAKSAPSIATATSTSAAASSLPSNVATSLNAGVGRGANENGDARQQLYLKWGAANNTDKRLGGAGTDFHVWVAMNHPEKVDVLTRDERARLRGKKATTTDRGSAGTPTPSQAARRASIESRRAPPSSERDR